MDVAIKTVLSTFLLTAGTTAIALQLPDTQDLDPLALMLDLVPFAAAIAAAAITTIHLRRENVRSIPLLGAAYSSFAGVLVGTLGVAHLVAVIAKAMDPTGTDRFIYDFRTYSLIQLGVFFIACGFIAAMMSDRMARGQRSAWYVSLVIWSVLLVINVPLIPLQGFAILFSVLAAVGIFVLYGMRSIFRVKLTVPDPER